MARAALPIMDASGAIVGYEKPKRRSSGRTAKRTTPKRGAAPKRSASPKPAAVAAPVPVQIVNKPKPRPRRPAAAKTEKRTPTAGSRKRKDEREAHRASFQGKVEGLFDSNRNVVRGVTIMGVAIGAVKLNQQYPDGLTPLKLEASTCVAVGTTMAAFAARHFGFKRLASAAVDVALGAVTGTLAADVQAGKTPLLAHS